MSSGCAATQSTRSASSIGFGDGGKPMRPDRTSPVTRACRLDRWWPMGSQWTASGAKDQQRKLNTVGTECVAEAVDDLALAREHEPGSARRDAYPTHLGGDSGALAPQLDQGVVDLVDALAQA